VLFPQNRYFRTFKAFQKKLDGVQEICHGAAMVKTIAKVTSGNNCFRIVIPKPLIKEMGWESIEYVSIRKNSLNCLEIRRLFYDENDNRQDHSG